MGPGDEENIQLEMSHGQRARGRSGRRGATKSWASMKEKASMQNEIDRLI